MKIEITVDKDCQATYVFTPESDDDKERLDALVLGYTKEIHEAHEKLKGEKP